MIETTVKQVDGVTFYSDIRILEPDSKKFGVPIHYISERVAGREPELIKYITSMGLRKVGWEPKIWGGSFEYAESRYYAMYNVLKAVWLTYWWVVRWLYDNARFFKQIPEAECFSWRYFTLYVWYRKLRK